MRATRRTLRTSVLAAGVVAGTAAMPVATAFADTPQPAAHQDQGGQDQSGQDQPVPSGWGQHNAAHDRLVPHAGVKAGAELPDGDHTPLLAAGGGMAAAGAAGLSFAMLRRGREQD
ncbi:hypothetical protein RCO28_34880 [Streptomyces sp. LHD-70]|uniref:hypothetical protein n=1 Tax=Streptomyces sp. LHD-70 TaxID=3072140 RepID=UPI00280E0E8B|nr:hypothetical protein [Streptomyces sp. LHD-70]MDQ8707620.1 hypothetical protein [Streptomyces sp. LHD-70]